VTLFNFFARLCPVPEAIDPAAMGPLPEPRGPLFNIWVPDPEFVEPPGAAFHTAPVAYRALEEPRWRRARLFALAALPALPHDLGRARPAHFRLDADLRTPAERERPRTLGERPPRAPPRPPAPARLRPPRDPGRAEPSRFRLDDDFTLPPERIGPAPRKPAQSIGFPARFWTQFVDPGRTLYSTPPFAAPPTSDWTQRHQERVEAQTFGGNPEGLYPYEHAEADAIEDAMDEVREQFFLRRDVNRVELSDEEMEVSLERETIERPAMEPLTPEFVPPVTFEEWQKLDIPLALAVPQGPAPSGEALSLLRTLQQALAEDPAPPPRPPK
jgi:hypothetical protein